MSPNNYTGWDIGGAHLKVAQLDYQGRLIDLYQFSTPLWRGIDELHGPVTRLTDVMPVGGNIHALTMTGELVDYFPDRRHGVTRLVDYISARLAGVDPVYVYAGENGLLKPAQVKPHSDKIASANWHATASYAATCLDSGVLVDIGTTTTDIIPFANARVLNNGYSDQQRMQAGELVYTGIVRTPIMAIVQHVPYRDVWQSVAAEYFATMSDVYRLTGELDEQFDLTPAADGKEKNQYGSAGRLARMLGTDYQEHDDVQPWVEVAEYIAGKQFEMIEDAYLKMKQQHEGQLGNFIVAAGAGRFIIDKLAKKHDCSVMNFEDLLQAAEERLEQINNCAAAVAVAQLTRLALTHEIT